LLYQPNAIYPPTTNSDKILKPNIMWPKAIRANGHLLLDGDKMSKSTGNFMTLEDAIEEFSADGMRLTLADCGDSLEDANFEKKTADSFLLRLHTQIKWSEEMLNNLNDLRPQNKQIFPDSVFENQINCAIQSSDENFSKTNFRDGLRSGFFQLQLNRDSYRTMCGKEKMRMDLILRFIEVQFLLIAPFTPHLSEHIWKLLKRNGSVRKASFPTISKLVDSVVLKQGDFMEGLLHSFHVLREGYMRPKKGPNKDSPSKLVVLVAKQYPSWMRNSLEIMKKELTKNPKLTVQDIAKILSSDPVLNKHMKKIVVFVMDAWNDFQSRGISALNLQLPFDEKELIEKYKEVISNELQIQNFEIKHTDSDDVLPLKPHPTFS